MDWLISGWIQFQCGIKIDSPVTTKGSYDPKKYWALLARGCAVNASLTDNNWEFWHLLEKPIDEVRKSYNIL